MCYARHHIRKHNVQTRVSLPVLHDTRHNLHSKWQVKFSAVLWHPAMTCSRQERASGGAKYIKIQATRCCRQQHGMNQRASQKLAPDGAVQVSSLSSGRKMYVPLDLLAAEQSSPSNNCKTYPAVHTCTPPTHIILPQQDFTCQISIFYHDNVFEQPHNSQSANCMQRIRTMRQQPLNGGPA